jgi:hypothetical protein
MYGSSTLTETKPAGKGLSLQEPARTVEVFMAGDVEHAKQVVRRFCNESPCCVTVTPTTYIYRGGEESGFVVGFRNYPRFPSDAYELRRLAGELADRLREVLGQDSYMVSDASGLSVWRSLRGEK